MNNKYKNIVCLSLIMMIICHIIQPYISLDYKYWLVIDSEDSSNKLLLRTTWFLIRVSFPLFFVGFGLLHEKINISLTLKTLLFSFVLCLIPTWIISLNIFECGQSVSCIASFNFIESKVAHKALSYAHLWVIIYLPIFYFITKVLDNLIDRYLNLKILLIFSIISSLFMSGAFIPDYPSNIIPYFRTFIYYYIFYVYGRILLKENSIYKINFYYIIIISIISFSLVYFLSNYKIDSELFQIVLINLSKALGAIFSFVFSYFIFHKINLSFLNNLKIKNIVFYFIFHLPVLLLIQLIAKEFNYPYYIKIVLVIIALSTILILIKTFFNSLLSKVDFD